MTSPTSFCGKCGQPLVATDDRFCRECGASLDAVSPVGTSTPITVTTIGRLPASAALSQVPIAPLVAGGFALLTALGTTQAWARAFFISVNGTETDRGVITLVVALVATAICAGRAFFGFRDIWYFGAGMLLAAVATTMPLWFLVDVLDSTPENNAIFNGRTIDPSFPLFMTIGGALGYSASLIWQLWVHQNPAESE